MPLPTAYADGGSQKVKPMRRTRLIACLAMSAAFFAAPAFAHEGDDADCGCRHHHDESIVLNGRLNTGDFDGGVGYGTAGDGYASGYSFSYGSASSSAFAGGFASAAAYARASASVSISISTHFGGGFHGGVGHGGGHGGYGVHGGTGGHSGMGGWGGGHH
jgi:hypothetical protein